MLDFHRSSDRSLVKDPATSSNVSPTRAGSLASFTHRAVGTTRWRG